MRLLVADDDKVNCCILEEVLAQAGHEPTIVYDGKAAWDVFQEKDAPQIAIIDWVMPEMDGLELCKKLRQTEQGRKVYLILLTGREDERYFIEGFEAGADDYILKPFGPRQLLARIQAGIRVIELQNELSIANSKLERAALTDALTDMPNRRYLVERLTQEWLSADRHGQSLSCMVLDIDRFKRVNDNYGHDVGDVVLKKVADILKSAKRENDIACRFGGEEFVVLCPSSSLREATSAAMRIRVAIETETVNAFEQFNHAITVSIGVAARQPNTADADALVKAADEALYAAKDAGRNCVFGPQGLCGDSVEKLET